MKCITASSHVSLSRLQATQAPCVGQQITHIRKLLGNDDTTMMIGNAILVVLRINE